MSKTIFEITLNQYINVGRIVIHMILSLPNPEHGINPFIYVFFNLTQYRFPPFSVDIL